MTSIASAITTPPSQAPPPADPRPLIDLPRVATESNHPHAASQGFKEGIKHAFMTWISQPEHKNRMRFAAGKYRDSYYWLLFPIEKVLKG